MVFMSVCSVYNFFWAAHTLSLILLSRFGYEVACKILFCEASRDAGYPLYRCRSNLIKKSSFFHENKIDLDLLKNQHMMK